MISTYQAFVKMCAKMSLLSLLLLAMVCLYHFNVVESFFFSRRRSNAQINIGGNDHHFHSSPLASLQNRIMYYNHKVSHSNVWRQDGSSTKNNMSPLLTTNTDDIMTKQEENDSSFRFSGVGKLLSSSEEEKDMILNRLKNATVAVVGIGGIGSWVAEALCRSGIGNLILVDLDDVCISNINRQLHAMSSTVGKMKTDVMSQRLLDINPQCNVTVIHDFISVDNVYTVLDTMLPQLTVCVDAIDGQTQKTALIAACCVRRVPIVTCGGAAGRSDPTKIICDDLTNAIECRLLFKCRKALRYEYSLFPKGPSKGKSKFRNWRIASVFSTEKSKLLPEGLQDTSSFRRCDGALGTACCP